MMIFSFDDDLFTKWFDIFSCFTADSSLIFLCLDVGVAHTLCWLDLFNLRQPTESFDLRQPTESSDLRQPTEQASYNGEWCLLSSITQRLWVMVTHVFIRLVWIFSKPHHRMWTRVVWIHESEFVGWDDDGRVGIIQRRVPFELRHVLGNSISGCPLWYAMPMRCAHTFVKSISPLMWRSQISYGYTCQTCAAPVCLGGLVSTGGLRWPGGLVKTNTKHSTTTTPTRVAWIASYSGEWCLLSSKGTPNITQLLPPPGLRVFMSRSLFCHTWTRQKWLLEHWRIVATVFIRHADAVCAHFRKIDFSTDVEITFSTNVETTGV